MASSSSSGAGRVAGTLALRTSSAVPAASLIQGLPDDVAAVILCLLTFPDQSRLRATVAELGVIPRGANLPCDNQCVHKCVRYWYFLYKLFSTSASVYYLALKKQDDIKILLH
jgi:hypothetical protein